MLRPIELPENLSESAIPQDVVAMISDVRRRVAAFQDRWDVPQIEQFVAADYQLVFQTIRWLRETQMLVGNRFIEWGCGFAAVTALAGRLGWQSFGIEAESTLLAQGLRTIDDWKSEKDWRDDIELFHGDFLPAGSDRLADDPTLPSLHHGIATAYDEMALELDDFAVVYSYPWPGEDDFHEAVFDGHAAVGAILVHFRGPNHMAVWRKTASRRPGVAEGAR
ncbi:MAG: class I SAM-dependent methyltransferase [Planctomycetota bacterium]